MSDFMANFLADKVHIHRWPQDSPPWSDSTQNQINDTINKNPQKIPVTINSKTVRVQDITFDSVKKIGISIPFFKDECRMIFEARFEDLFAHVHLTIKSENFLDIFKQLMVWKNKEFSSSNFAH